MPRKSSMIPEMVATAKDVVSHTRDAHELRRAQAVLLPHKFGFNGNQVGEIIGKSRPTVARLRREFKLAYKGEAIPRTNWGGRRRQNMTLDEEKVFLEPFLVKAQQGGILIVTPVKKAYEKAVGHAIPDSTIYRILARHGWRKVAPDKRHPKSDLIAQEEFKKTSRRS